VSTIRSGASWLLGGNLAGRLVQFAVGMVLARLLAPAEFGLLVTIQVFTGLAGFLVGAGMGEALVQSKSAGQRDFNVVFSLYLGSCLSIYGLFFLLAPVLAAAFDEPRYVWLVRISALSFLWRPFLTMPTVLLRREMRFALLAKVEFLNLIVSSAASLGLAASGYGVWALVLGGQLGTLVHIAVLAARSGWMPGLAWELAIARRLIGYGVKFTLNDIAVYLRPEAVNLLLSSQLGPAAVGLYNKAASLAVLPSQTISGSVYQPLFRALSAHQDNDDTSQYLYIRAITLVMAYTLPCYVLLAILGEPCIAALYGEAWRSAGTALALLSLIGPVNVLNNVSGAVCAARNRLGRELEIQCTTVLLILLGAWLGLGYGVSGVALGVIPATLLLAVRMIWLALAALNLKLAALRAPILALLPPLAAMLLASLGARYALPPEWSRTLPLSYCALVAIPGASAYVLVLLLWPATSLADEAARWRRQLLKVVGRKQQA
jgi:teichuronic acid exporter